MAYKINSDCSNCGACEPECPNQAISQGNDVYVINPDLCTECVGHHASAQCAGVCPTDSCVPDPAHTENEAALIAKAKKIHPKKDFSGSFPSHFRK